MLLLPVYTGRMQFWPRTAMQFTAPFPFFFGVYPLTSAAGLNVSGISITISTY